MIFKKMKSEISLFIREDANNAHRTTIDIGGTIGNRNDLLYFICLKN